MCASTLEPTYSHREPLAVTEIDMQSLDALRNYLDAESIEHDGAMPLKHLQMLVVLRLKCRAREQGERPQHSPSLALSTVWRL